jgi:phage tail-like protein
MSDRRLRRYVFATAKQWQSGLATGFDIAADGALRPIARFGLRATPVSDEPTDLLAAAPDSVRYFRGCSEDGVRRVRQSDDSGSALAFEPSGDLSVASRWAVDADSIWAFSPGATKLSRTLRRSLRVDHEIDVARELGRLIESDVSGLKLLDVASDTRCGIWVLVEVSEPPDGKPAYSAVRLNAEGCATDRICIPPGAECPTQLVVVDCGKTLVLLAASGRLLVFLDIQSRAPRRSVAFNGLSYGWRGERIASDGRNRVVVAGKVQGQYQFYVFSSAGDSIDGPFDAGEELTDVAIWRDRIWFSSVKGICALSTSNGGGGARESESGFMTPLLLSPETERGRGWLRAEVYVDLPEHGTLEADFAGTDHPATAKRVSSIMSETNRDTSARAASVWNEFDDVSRHHYSFSGAQTPNVPVAIPIFNVSSRWLVLGIRVIAPPGATPPVVHRIVVRYPDASVAENIPAIFKSSDSTGFLRRVLGVLESTTQQIDGRIAAIGKSLTSGGATSEMLDYIAQWLGLPWDASLSESVRRDLLANAHALTAHRGTRAGLQQLLTLLMGGKARIAITDLTGDHTVARLGGGHCEGARLPVLLAGTRLGTATLGGKAVLGRACLPLPGAREQTLDPLASITQQLRIVIATDHAAQRAFAPLLDGLLKQYLPAGVKYSIAWRIGPTQAGADDGVLILDDEGPAVLGTDRRLGGSTLGGASGFLLH